MQNYKKIRELQAYLSLEALLSGSGTSGTGSSRLSLLNFESILGKIVSLKSSEMSFVLLPFLERLSATAALRISERSFCENESIWLSVCSD